MNGMYLSEKQMNDLNELAYLPVRYKDGSRHLAYQGDRFFIADRIELEAAFMDKVPMLDFTLAQTARLQPFLSSLGLEARYMSRRVKLATEAVNPAIVISSRLTNSFRKRAKYLYRYAPAFPRYSC